MLEMMDAENLLMFSSDYPHWDFDSPTNALPKLPDALHRRLFEENARAWYGL
jgi:predicted TIM-barrel fold metal-dependent hydrolase